jgi:hypothetical protein
MNIKCKKKQKDYLIGVAERARSNSIVTRGSLTKVLVCTRNSVLCSLSTL